MKRAYIFLIILLIKITAVSAPVDSIVAKKVALAFLSQESEIVVQGGVHLFTPNMAWKPANLKITYSSNNIALNNFNLSMKPMYRKPAHSCKIIEKKASQGKCILKE